MSADLFGKQPNTAPLDGEKGRVERGAFFTPDLLAQAICRSTSLVLAREVHSIFEPGCGGGAFLRAAHAQWPLATLLGVDLAPACEGPGTVLEDDLFEVREERFDLVLGNPDYAIAEKAVRHCLGLLAPKGHLVFLLRAAFLGGSGRVPLYTEHPLRYLQPVAQRPSFTGGGSDPMEYCVFTWREGWKSRGELLAPLVWR